MPFPDRTRITKANYCKDVHLRASRGGGRPLRAARITLSMPDFPIVHDLSGLGRTGFGSRRPSGTVLSSRFSVLSLRRIGSALRTEN